MANCKLCISRIADKPNSHIFPKFIKKGMFGDGSGKKAFRMDTRKMDQKPIPIQDLTKENNILCSICELRLARLESYISKEWFYKFKNQRYSHEFPTRKLLKFRIKVCANLNFIAFRLFIYSLLWRAHISMKENFDEFELLEPEECLIRNVLNDSLKEDHQQLLEECDLLKNKIDYFPFLIWSETNDFFNRNFVLIDSDKRNPYKLYLNNFRIAININHSPLQVNCKSAINDKNEQLKVLIVSNKEWERETKEFLMEFAKKGAKILNQNKKTPYDRHK